MTQFTAPAKLNLHLHITGKEANGYHRLQSLAIFLDVADELSIVAADTLSLEIKGQFAAGLSSADNLVLKAADALQTTRGAKITLEKNIPVGAGLGGGSSDAATTLNALNALWQLGLSNAELQKLSLKLGSDVPACLENKTVWIEGIGEKLTPCRVPVPLHLVLVNPLKPLSTPAVYQRYNGEFQQPTSIPEFTDFDNVVAWLGETENALTHAATAFTPEIQTMLDGISKTGAKISRMSGSGATCFGLYADELAATHAAKNLKEIFPNYWVKACKSL